MKLKELIKEFEQLGLTPEKVLEIVVRYEKQKEKVKKYQKEVYEKVSVSVRKEIVNQVLQLTGIDSKKVKKYLAALKLVNEVSKEEREIIRDALQQIEGK
jgi:bifunctional DNA-binding transcriptional regulator/antitoxin component of YhaV-PrlF toxin-antitoxin module